MNFHLAIIIFTCITLEGAIASRIIKSQESFDDILNSQDNGEIERVNFGNETWFFSMINFLIKWLTNLFGYTGFSSHERAEELSPWPEAQIPYIIDDNFRYSQKNIIMDAIEEFHKYTCVRFLPYDGEQAHIRISPSINVCESTVGYTGYDYDIKLTSRCANNKGAVMHELMHVIGFIHEHSRHDRDDYVTIIWDNIQYGAEHNFDKSQNEDLNDFGLPYDFNSLMHYSDSALSFNGEKTIIPKLDLYTDMGQLEGFSQIDIAKINRMYGCS